MAPLLPLSFVNLAGRSGTGASSGGNPYEPLGQQPSTPIEKANLRSFQSSKSGSSSSNSSSSSSSNSSSSSSSNTSRPGTRLLSALIHLAVIGFAAFGVASLVEEKLGRLVRVHRLTTEQLSQTGWERQPLVVSAHDDILSNNNNLHDHASESSSSASNQKQQSTSAAVFRDFSSNADAPASIDQQHLLILTPCRNCADTLERYFQLVTALDHPKQQTSIGFLVSDETDATVDLMTDFIAAHQDDYRRMTLLRKDFTIPDVLEGSARHSAYLQDQRRQIMAKARTFLVSSTLEPSVDWVLWLDSDIFDMPSSLFEDLLVYGNAGVGEQPNDTAVRTGEPAPPAWDPAYDIITPNIFTRSSSGGHLTGYDMNNWAETSSSIAMKSSLSTDAVLVEGNILHPTGRLHLADVYHSSNYSEAPDFLPSELPSSRQGIDRFDPESPAYIGRRLPLDGVGGVSTLVRATAHRVGGIFPAFVVDHQVETEGFAVLARTLGARICGLPNYGVLHASPH